jgi:hypothetical protein
MTKSTDIRLDRKAIDSIKRTVKRELDAVDATGAAKERLQRALQRVAALEDRQEPRAQLTRFVFVISSLVQHARFGGLSAAQVRKAAELATTILATEGITPGTSRLSFLHGELHLVLSQIYRKDGAHWHAAWQQYEAMTKARRSLPGGDAFQSLALGNRALRLGHARLALAHFARAEAGPLSPADLEKARLAHIKALRLSGNLDASEALSLMSMTMEMSADGHRELVWEGFCRGVVRGASPAAMLASVKSGRMHHDAIYLLEASLWTKALARREWMDKVISVRTMGKKPAIKPHRFGSFHALAALFDRCYDLETPLTFRIRDLGETLADAASLTTIDKELLAWVAAARFLARSRAFDHAALALAEYAGICLRLSDGATRDVLGVAGDLLERPWFANAFTESTETDQRPQGAERQIA